MWDYQRERQQYTKFCWDRDNRQHRTQYQAEYREQHPEETREQRLKDWKAFKERNPERWREINRQACARYRAKQKLLRQAEREALAQKEKAIL